MKQRPAVCGISTVPGRDGIEKKEVGRYGTVRYGTVWISRGTVRYAVSNGDTALPRSYEKKTSDNDF